MSCMNYNCKQANRKKINASKLLQCCKEPRGHTFVYAVPVVKVLASTMGFSCLVALNSFFASLHIMNRRVGVGGVSG